MKNIIYFSPKNNIPSGGVKVIHRHSELVNDLGFRSEIFYMPGDSKDVSWFKHGAKIKTDGKFSPKSDFVILPESLMYDYWKFFSEHNIPYGIFVQNGYLINKNIQTSKLRECYENSKLIITISDDSSHCICTIFPDLISKIIRVSYSVDENIFFPRAKKNIITYMPRKMSAHSDLLISILSQKIPSNWGIEKIDRMSEEQG